MILTISDIVSVSRWLSFWEFVEYASEAVVFLGCVGEFIAEYTKWWTEERRHALGRFSLAVLILGLGTGLLSLIKTNSLSGIVIESLGDQAKQAGQKAQLAISTADSAIRKSSQAVTESGDAVATSGRAEGSASNALILAKGARQEADSFEKDIVSAKKQAADAELHLAEALREVQKLQVAAAWREFPEADSNKLISLTKQRFPRTPTFTVAVESVVGNPEALRYGGLLSSSLSTALTMPVKKPGGISTCLECTGVWVCVNENATPETSSDAKAIRDLLEAAGVRAAKFCTDPKNGQGNANSIIIIIGPKE